MKRLAKALEKSWACRCAHGRPDPPRAAVASAAPSAAPTGRHARRGKEQNPLAADAERPR